MKPCIVCRLKKPTQLRHIGVIRYRICDDCEQRQRQHEDDRAQKAIDQAEKAGA